MSLLSPRRAAGPRRLSPLAMFEALATPHGIDRYLELVHPMLTVRELRAEVVAVQHATDDAVTPDPAPHPAVERVPGRPVRLGTVDIDGVRRTRCYSPACSQHRADGCIELTIKAHPEGLVSNYLHAHAPPGWWSASARPTAPSPCRRPGPRSCCSSAAAAASPR